MVRGPYGFSSGVDHPEFADHVARIIWSVQRVSVLGFGVFLEEGTSRGFVV